MLKLTTDKHETSHGLSATAELLLVLDSWQRVASVSHKSHARLLVV